MKFIIGNVIDKIKYNPNSVKENYDGKTDIYLSKVSYRYAYFKRIVCVLLIIASTLLLLSGMISYEKLFYLTKDIKLANDYVTSVHDTITYNVGNSQCFATYREGLAVASRERISIFSAGGREIFAANHNYGNPALASSDKYLLLYDVGGKQFALFNSFSQVRSETFDYPIYGASIAANGTFALITRTDSYDSVVSVYKNNETQIDYNFSEGRVVSVAFTENASNMVILLSFSDGDAIRTELRSYKVGKENYQKADLTFSGIPYGVKILSGGNIIVVGSHGVNAFNSNLNLIGEYLIDEEIYLYYLGEDNIAISHLSSERGKTEVVILNRRAGEEKKYLFNERVLDIAVSESSLFVQTLGGFERIDVSTNASSKSEVVAVEYKMLVIDKDTVIICNDSHAKYLNFNK